MDAQSESRFGMGLGDDSTESMSSMQPEAPMGDNSDVTDLMDHAKRSATETASDAGNMFRQRVDDQYQKLGERLDEMVTNMNEAADSLDEAGSSGASSMIHTLAGQMERVGGYMHDNSANDILSDAKRYANQHAWTVIGVSMIAGLAASRFLKASGSEASRAAQQSSSRPVQDEIGGTEYRAAA